ncbi:His Kinase A (phospho-acceptor) domain-containing protein [Nonlabens sp. Hel1_33_55]|uniref:sensor histidine kinase n=1 Tax=Nonlabens sp. Hel1_33_55 TaxID=1336802 RepID=UPI000875E178|nr:ATP-binding protein [Nonlabens sp. Hel1_33_55]SCX99212.1 His Kinase A (phospho-acceptor) domain-containing protein [Nonlabens sp. Hel1_33_55]
MNPLLKRQIRKFLPADLRDREDLQSFLKSIGDSYDNMEDQFKMTQRAMTISSDELFEANQALREETEQQRRLLERLEAVINSVNTKNTDENDAAVIPEIKQGNLADYISNQADQLIAVNKNQERLLQELALQNQELNDYAHIVSHDLKSPLRSIEALVSWLKEDYEQELGDEGKAQIELIVTHLEKMDALIQGILSYSSIDKEERKENSIDLNKLMSETIDLLHVPPHIEVKIHNLPSITADRFKIQQLFQNLIGNAVANMDKTEGRIDLIARKLDQGVQFEVKDNGKGIHQDYYGKIFQVFQKLEDDSMSTGIGLSIVKKIVNYYGGTIWLDSELNKGTTFYFTLPKTI